MMVVEAGVTRTSQTQDALAQTLGQAARAGPSATGVSGYDTLAAQP